MLVCVLLYFIDPRVRKIRIEASRVISVHFHLFFKVTGFYRPVNPSLKVN